MTKAKATPWAGTSRSGLTKRCYVLVSPDGWIREESTSCYPNECWNWGDIETGLSKMQMIKQGYTVQKCKIILTNN